MEHVSNVTQISKPALAQSGRCKNRFSHCCSNYVDYKWHVGSL